MTKPALLGPDDLYVHVADDGGIFVVAADRGLSAWVTLAGLRARVEDPVSHGGTIYLSTEKGSWLGAPAAQIVADCGARWVQVDPLSETRRQGGVTALISAAGVGSISLLDDLLARHADLEACDDLGRTALMAAASKGEVATLRRLIDAGATLDHTDRQGSSALVLAAYFGWADAVRVLLDSGADPTLRDHHGKDARTNAEDRGHPKVAAMLPAPPAGGVRAGVVRAGSAGRWRRLGWLRTRPVLVDEPDELVVRTFDGFVLRVMGLGVLIVSLIIGAASVSLSGLAHGAAAGVFMLAFCWALGWLGSRQAVRVSGTSLQTRFPLRWKPAIDLREVAAAHYIPRMRAWPALQLLQADRGSLRPVGVQRWQGVEPKPTGPGGGALRCLMVPLGPAYGRVLNRVAPILDHYGTIFDPYTRAQTDSYLR
ncbi:MAG: ankyrin repeat domain-containing protein [Acidimicrobiales bacterium]